MIHGSTKAGVAALAARMSECASAFLDGLRPEQRPPATFDFANDVERRDWAYFPRGHKGLPLAQMDQKQQKLAHALITSSLSLPAYAKVAAIMALESVLNLLEERRLDAARDPGRYFISVFGEPDQDVWGWRLEGHHVCLNYTLAGEQIAGTPLFLGANPAEVRHGETPVARPCGEEEDAARDLLFSLDAEQRRLAIICEAAPPDIVLMNAPAVPRAALPGEAGANPFVKALFAGMKREQQQALRFDRAAPLGIAASQMTDSQRQLLDRLIDVYIDRLPAPLAVLERTGAGGPMHFAWAGEERPRLPHYYRLQGGSFLVEYDNTQDGANHVHAVWRDAERDFGEDLLRQHLARAHR